MSKSKLKKPTRSSIFDMKGVSSSATAQDEQREARAKWWREAIESVVIAIVLALLFRTFEAEAFVIPTGSMAPTLQGRHKDVVCEKCNYRYRTGASEDNERQKGLVGSTTCPMCRYTMDLDWDRNHNHKSFTGDRILVNKFAYQYGEPKRWDVIVFKFPGNAKQNYIKRLIGLPRETIRIWHGDIYVRQDGSEEFRIARKPPRKLVNMLQPVCDTDYVAQKLIDSGWPARWQSTVNEQDQRETDGWQSSQDRSTYTLSQDASQSVSWLRYHHIVPTLKDWREIEYGETRVGFQRRQGELITDFYAYNAGVHRSDAFALQDEDYTAGIYAKLSGLHWVGDLALECELEVLSDTGEILLDLVEGGRHYECRLDVSNGLATLSIDGGRVPFAHEKNGKPVYTLSQTTSVSGPGTYDLRFANVDDQLLLWVDDGLWIGDGLVAMDATEGETPGAYRSPVDTRPRWSPADPGDLTPVGIGGKNVALQVNRLRVLRDVYYIATRETMAFEPAVDYDIPRSANGAREWRRSDDMLDEVRGVFTDPRRWAGARLFDLRRYVDFHLKDDEFFPMGDNSPQSKDARLWHSNGVPRVESSVKRELLTGKAFLIYWPHPWFPGTGRLPAVVPNVSRMGLIR